MTAALQHVCRAAQFCLVFKLVNHDNLGSLRGDHDGVTMLLMCFMSLGAAASRAVKLPGLLLIVSLLAIAIGLEGAMSHRTAATVLVDAVLMLFVVESAYVAASVLWFRAAQVGQHRKL
ncbi:hypothetical protein [Methylobacterium sp. Leaf117]|uniref:hypothetical protein n=1 Tax=Methylobacterium sp. Leaf117 TaxID=1736260 RepID=UPI0012E1661F|nr:hypothetical protein [Methylobacterium sp. Leaf117]